MPYVHHMEIDDTETPQKKQELLTDIPVVGGISEESSCATDARELKPTYGKEGARALVKNEIFNTIGKEKIARVKSTPPGFVLNLTVDESDYIIAEVLKGASSKGTAVKIMASRSSQKSAAIAAGTCCFRGRYLLDLQQVPAEFAADLRQVPAELAAGYGVPYNSKACCKNNKSLIVKTTSHLL
ncbi:hypothetical protein RhiirB3_438136 [Rhizophagus irregularis]|nr:hypothetical protein RhiirB3_438136 [Rhizophagus irregularis]